VSALLELAQEAVKFSGSSPPGLTWLPPPTNWSPRRVKPSPTRRLRRPRHQPQLDYDYEAYEEVKRNLARLIASGKLREAMQLSLELMKEGSCQVEMSDEGLMTDDIEECLSVVLQALKKCDLPAADITSWCSAMLEHDRVGCIALDPLQSLRTHFEAATR